jgi:processive 1,2-diacylglycerol beta-glucosyltransferase
MLRGIESPVQIPIICGRNESLQKDLEKFASQHQKEFPIFKILGFTKEMHEWMHLADLFIGKPGGLTTSECLACGLPMVIWHPIPGQEVYNSNYLLENGAAVTPDTASTLGYKVDQLLKDPQRLERMQQQARKLAHPNAAQDILETILEKPNEIPVKVSKRRA